MAKSFSRTINCNVSNRLAKFASVGRYVLGGLDDDGELCGFFDESPAILENLDGAVGNGVSGGCRVLWNSGKTILLYTIEFAQQTDFF
jgi:hypothetical protein